LSEVGVLASRRFEFSPNGSGGWNETVLHSFKPNGTVRGGSIAEREATVPRCSSAEKN
jgi:hypothetical protein